MKNSIVTSDFLDQFINDNDKEPFWDGAIYIYDNKSKKKVNFWKKTGISYHRILYT